MRIIIGMNNKVIIIQAGGKGTRMKNHTWNRPKCLVPVLGKPLLYHIFDSFPSWSFIIIGDYHYNTLKNYLITAPYEKKIDYQLIKSTGSGSIAGIKKSISNLKNNTKIIITWSDILFTSKPKLELNKFTKLGVTNKFKCRFSVTNTNQIVKKTSSKHGIFGFYYFPSKKILNKIPSNGEFVEWISKSKLEFKKTLMENVTEIGEDGKLLTFSENQKGRFFNELKISEKLVIKKPKIKKFNKLIDNEINWYQHLQRNNYAHIPKIYSYSPLRMEKINGKHPYEIFNDKEQILQNIIYGLEKIHKINRKSADNHELFSVYYDKTLDRVYSVRDMIPNFKKKEIKINNLLCKNYMHESYLMEFQSLIKDLLNNKNFNIIHGDPTFSNIIIRDIRNEPIFIDPRGYFGSKKLFGDPLYDFAKLYYSLNGNYDNFNQKKFVLKIYENEVQYFILDNQWTGLTPILKNKLGNQFYKIKIIHFLIWLSLTGYVLEDYDAVLTSFYRGLWLIEEYIQNPEKIK